MKAPWALTKLSALALICALSACGGGGDDDDNNNGGGGTGTPGEVTPPGGGGEVTPPTTPATFTVTPSASAGGSISPAVATEVQEGATVTFTLTPDEGFGTLEVGGTCGGTLDGNTYTTNAITANCTVQASFAAVAGPEPNPRSITACFTAPQTVSFSLTALNAPSGTVTPNRSTTGPMTLNGAAVTGQAVSYPSNAQSLTTQTDYWSVTDTGVTFLGVVREYANAGPETTPSGRVLPQDMAAGDTAVDSADPTNVWTFVGFEDVTLAGRTFANTCHFSTLSGGETFQLWYAAGYGVIRTGYVDAATDGGTDVDGLIVQYDGN
jgi:hypothetical protein